MTQPPVMGYDPVIETVSTIGVSHARPDAPRREGGAVLPSSERVPDGTVMATQTVPDRPDGPRGGAQRRTTLAAIAAEAGVRCRPCRRW